MPSHVVGRDEAAAVRQAADGSVGDMPRRDRSHEIGEADVLSPSEEIRLSHLIQRGRNAAARLEAFADADPGDDAAQLTPAVRRRLKDEETEGRRAHDLFVTSNLRLVQLHLNRLRLPFDVDESDIFQEGVTGLMRAVDRFDGSKGYRFATFATPWVRRTMTKAITRAKSKVAGTANARFLMSASVTAWDAFRATHGRPPEDSEMAAILGVTERRLVEIRAGTRSPASLEEPVAGHDSAGTPLLLGDTLADADAEAALADVEAADLGAMLSAVLDGLPSDERDALRDRMSDMTSAAEDGSAVTGVQRKQRNAAASRAVSRLRHPAMQLTGEMTSVLTD